MSATEPKARTRDTGTGVGTPCCRDGPLLVAHGVTNASLRPMAARLGTSPRMLMFHFTSKEQLVREALERLHARLQSSLA
jgi:hypothetical protein